MIHEKIQREPKKKRRRTMTMQTPILFHVAKDARNSVTQDTIANANTELISTTVGTMYDPMT